MTKLQRPSRRAILEKGALWLGSSHAIRAAADQAPAVRFGVLTDAHHANKPELGTRYYRESLSKLAQGVAKFREARVEFLVELGDLVDAAEDVDTERAWLKQAADILRRTGVEMHCVLGNHCIQTLTKEHFLIEVDRKQSYYSFIRNGVHFIVLDACFRKDGVSYNAGNFDWKDTEIPLDEQDWLRRDLSRARRPVVVFVHQRLDTQDVYAVASAAAVRDILERSGKVIAVLQGHSHKNDHKQINAIDYCTLRAVVEGSGPRNNGYSVVSVYRNGALQLEGFEEQRSYAIGVRNKAVSS
jgi:alkaline phosphatase